MYMHVTVHTAQAWADTFISELNDTHVEKEQRIRFVPPFLDFSEASAAFCRARGRRLLVLGLNNTLTEAIEEPLQLNRHFAQRKAQKQMNKATGDYVRKLAENPAVTVVILSGADRCVLSEMFADCGDVWLVSENGLYMRPPKHIAFQGPDDDEWICNLPSANRDWMDAVELVFEYFCERTPRSYMDVSRTAHLGLRVRVYKP
jgi:trehalose 6-phosphate synthase/phosphatase